MTSDWLEPSITSRVNGVVDRISDNEHDGLYLRFMEMLKSIRNITNEQIIELENLYVLREREVADYSYRVGLSDGSGLLQQVARAPDSFLPMLANI